MTYNSGYADELPVFRPDDASSQQAVCRQSKSPLWRMAIMKRCVGSVLVKLFERPASSAGGS